MKKMLSKVLALTLCVALGLSLAGGAFAAEETSGSMVLTATGLDWGSPVIGATVTLDSPIGELTKEDIKVEVTYTAMDWSILKYVDYTAERIVDGFTVSDDGLTVELELGYDYAATAGSETTMEFTTFTVTLGDVVVTEVTGIVHEQESKWGRQDANLELGHYGYRWHDPSADYEMPEGGYPLIVWSHGYGDENSTQITDQRVTAWAEKESQDIFGGAYVIAMQCYKSATPESAKISTWQPDSVINTINSFIEKIGEDKINTNKIVIGGCSAGGIALLNTIKAYPDYFAAAFPICTNTTFVAEELIGLRDMPIYIIQSIDDNSVSINSSINLYNDLTSTGKTNAYLALFEHVVVEGEPNPGVGHWSWIYAHNNFDGTEEYWAETYTHTDGKTYTMTKPTDLGYESFKHWLAAQILEDTYYTRDRDVMAYGETINGVTLYGVERIKATETVQDWLASNEIVVTVIGGGVDEEGNAIDVVRKPVDYIVGEDRTSLTLVFEVADFIAPIGSVTAPYVVTLNGEEIQYRGDESDTADFLAKTYTTPEYTRRGQQLTSMDTRYFVPDKETYAAPEDGYALVVWLHGGGETGTDNRKPVAANDVHAWTEKASQDIFGGAYVLAPQNHASAGLGAPQATMSVIEQFVAEMGDIDVDRIYVGGCSYGGIGTWEMLRNYPYFFAAGFPICCGPTGGLTSVEATALNNTPIYMVTSTGDSSGIVSSMTDAYNDLVAAGSEVVHFAMFEHSEFPGQDTFNTVVGAGILDHWSWVYVHEDFDATGDDYDGKNFIDTTVDGTYNDGKVVVADGVLTYTYESGTDEEGNPVSTSISLNGKTERPADLGAETFKTWLAAQVNPNESITVHKTVEAWGEIVSSITLNLETPVVDAESITVGVDSGAEDGTLAEPAIADIAVSEDGLTVTITYEKGLAWDAATGISYLGYEVTVDGRTITRISGSTSEVDKFEALTFTTPEYTWRGSTTTTMEARAFTPDKETYPVPENGYPLIVWLHGGGEAGTDNRIQIAANDVPAWTEKETQDIFGGAYVLAPQNHAYADNGENAPAATMSVIQQFIAANPDIDPTRVYVGGCSYGGRGTFEMIREYPNFFAAAYPTCASIYDATTFEILSEQELDWLKDMPVYMSVSSGDQAKYVMSMITFYNKMVELGNENVHLAIFEHSDFEGYPEHILPVGTLDHWVWVYLHDNYDAKGDDKDGANFIDSTVDGTYNDGKIVVENGVLTYNYTWKNDEGVEEELSITLNGKTERPEDTGYETIKEWIAAQVNPTPSVFDDVTGETEGYEAIMALYADGLTTGTSVTTYEPEVSLTRAEFMTFLARAVEATVDNTADTGFTDVAVNSWETGSIAWGVGLGLIEGYGDGTFGPEDPVTEEQVNLIIGRLIENVSGVTAADGQTIADATAEPATRGQVAGVIKAVADNYTAPRGWW